MPATSIRETPEIMQFEPMKEEDTTITITCLITCERQSLEWIKTLKALIVPCLASKFQGTLQSTMLPVLLDVELSMVINGLRKKIDILRAQVDMSSIHSGTVNIRPSVDATMVETLQLVAGIPLQSCPSDDATMGKTLEWEGQKFILEPTMFGKNINYKWAEWLSGDLLPKYMTFIMPVLALDITMS
ncbi:hypothetical protein HWV62_33946 [Athelia sp. TMB]|nr:hypothetical protein HWV62_33946 [Athelia sp. TMB]